MVLASPTHEHQAHLLLPGAQSTYKSKTNRTNSTDTSQRFVCRPRRKGFPALNTSALMMSCLRRVRAECEDRVNALKCDVAVTYSHCLRLCICWFYCVQICEHVCMCVCVCARKYTYVGASGRLGGKQVVLGHLSPKKRLACWWQGALKRVVWSEVYASSNTQVNASSQTRVITSSITQEWFSSIHRVSVSRIT
jgi:hypothetical protein